MIRESVNFESIMDSVVMADQLPKHETISIVGCESPSKMLLKLSRKVKAKQFTDTREFCVWLHPDTARQVTGDDFIEDNFEIRVDHTMPPEYILYARPNVIGLDGKVYDTNHVAYAKILDMPQEAIDEFETKWHRYKQIVDDIEAHLNMIDADNTKERVRELWYENKISFVDSIPERLE